MGKIRGAIVAIVVGLGVSVAVIGCSNSSGNPTGDKMSGGKMEGKMSGDKMAGDKMSGESKMSGGKMAGDKMSVSK